MDLVGVLGCLFDGSDELEIFGQLSTFVNFTTMFTTGGHYVLINMDMWGEKSASWNSFGSVFL